MSLESLESTIWKGEFVTSPYETELNDVTSVIREAITADDATYGWQSLSHKDPNITSFYKEVPGIVVPLCKCKTTFPVSVEVTRRILACLEYRHTWDDRLFSYEYIDFFDPSTLVAKTCFTAPWPVAKRDFVIAIRTYVEEDGGMFVVGRSIDDERAPNNESSTGVVRGDIKMVGYTLKPNAENPQHCDVVYVMQTDPKGSIPNFIVKGVKLALTEMLGKIHKVVEDKKVIAAICDKFGEQWKGLMVELEKRDGKKY